MIARPDIWQPASQPYDTPILDFVNFDKTIVASEYPKCCKSYHNLQCTFISAHLVLFNLFLLLVIYNPRGKRWRPEVSVLAPAGFGRLALGQKCRQSRRTWLAAEGNLRPARWFVLHCGHWSRRPRTSGGTPWVCPGRDSELLFRLFLGTVAHVSLLSQFFGRRPCEVTVVPWVLEFVNCKSKFEAASN